VPDLRVALPDGTTGTVPDVDLHLMPAGTKVIGGGGAPAVDDGGLAGGLAAGILGAGSAVTLGTTDRLFREGAYVVGGPQLSRDVTTNLRNVRERNPMATMAGEFGGLILAPEALSGVGEAAAGTVAGEGLAAAMARSSARFAAESALIGAQQRTTEDALGDHQYNAEAVFAQAGKDALIGAAAGAPLGALGYGAGKAYRGARGLFAGRSGPIASGALDEVAGVEGAGRKLLDEARLTEDAIQGVRSTGATAEQAAGAVSEMGTLGKARAALDADAGLSAEMRAGEAIRPDGSTGYRFDTRRVPLDEINVPAPWDETKLPPLRAAREAGVELDPIRVGRMSEQEPFDIVDGIHRANIARERGERDILARYEVETKPYRLSDGATDFVSPVETGAGPIDIGALRPPAPRQGAPSQIAAAIESPQQRANGLARGLVDSVADRYTVAHGGERGSMLRKHYEEQAARTIDADLAADARARKLADAGTKVMRLEDTLNEVNFTERPDQFARLLDPSKYNAARDTLSRMGQDMRALLGELDMLPTRSLAPTRIGKVLQEADLIMGNLPADASERALRDAWSAQYRVKQSVGKFAGFGKAAHLRTPEENALGELYEKLRVGFEDTGSFGAAGDANREWNQAFSDQFGRRKDYGGRFSVSIDQGPGGTPLPEIDAGKIKGFLNQLGGAEADQAVKSTEAMIDWERQRIAAIEKHGLLTPAQKTAIAEGRANVDAFEKEFQSARKDAEAANRVRQAKLDEGGGVGGVLGFFTDTVTRPATTVERFARVAQAVDRVEEGVRSNLRKIGVGSSGESAAQRAPRPREKIISDIESIRVLAANPAALEQAASRMVGDLSNYAPKMANELRLTAMRTLLYLAREAPPASTTETGAFGKPTPRYSDIQLHDWDRKATAALDARTLAIDVKSGRLNRDAIEAAKFSSPKLFGKLQDLARDELVRMQKDGTLDRMSYQDKASFATLLEIPPDQTWTGEFMAMIQASKAAPPPPSDESASAPQGQLPRKSNQKPIADSFMTAAGQIEAGGNDR